MLVTFIRERAQKGDDVRSALVVERLTAAQQFEIDVPRRFRRRPGCAGLRIVLLVALRTV